MKLSLICCRTLVLFLCVACIGRNLFGGTSGSPRDSKQHQPVSSRVLLEQLRELNQGWETTSPKLSIVTEHWSGVESEKKLIQIHLRLVIDRLENTNVEQLTEEQLANRKRNIQVLKGYAKRGRFPTNLFVQGRRPVFIDPWGVHCAVGYLMAQSGCSELAESVNLEHQLDYIANITTTGVSEWQIQSGLSVKELALIQPSYHYTQINYPKEVEDLILGDSAGIMAAIKVDSSLIQARLGGRTLLHFAAAAGDLELCKYLVANGADINAVSEQAKVVYEKRSPEIDPKTGRPKYILMLKISAYYLRWNEPTLCTNRLINGSKPRMGVGGRVFTNLRGRLICNQLMDRYKGREGLTAVDCSSYRQLINRYKIYGNKKEVPKEAAELARDREIVKKWLQENGGLSGREMVKDEKSVVSESNS